jgi:hypothetical protein
MVLLVSQCQGNQMIGGKITQILEKVAKNSQKKQKGQKVSSSKLNLKVKTSALNPFGGSIFIHV